MLCSSKQQLQSVHVISDDLSPACPKHVGITLISLTVSRVALWAQSRWLRSCTPALQACPSDKLKLTNTPFLQLVPGACLCVLAAQDNCRWQILTKALLLHLSHRFQAFSY